MSHYYTDGSANLTSRVTSQWFSLKSKQNYFQWHSNWNTLCSQSWRGWRCSVAESISQLHYKVPHQTLGSDTWYTQLELLYNSITETKVHGYLENIGSWHHFILRRCYYQEMILYNIKHFIKPSCFTVKYHIITKNALTILKKST